MGYLPLFGVVILRRGVDCYNDLKKFIIVGSTQKGVFTTPLKGVIQTPLSLPIAASAQRCAVWTLKTDFLSPLTENCIRQATIS
jgi:hypothetical protein